VVLGVARVKASRIAAGGGLCTTFHAGFYHAATLRIISREQHNREITLTVLLQLSLFSCDRSGQAFAQTPDQEQALVWTADVRGSVGSRPPFLPKGMRHRRSSW
jgi:hypothetical protein